MQSLVVVVKVVVGGCVCVGRGGGGSANVSCGEKETEMTGEKAFLQRKIPNQIIPPSAQLLAPSSKQAPGLNTFASSSRHTGGPLMVHLRQR